MKPRRDRTYRSWSQMKHRCGKSYRGHGYANDGISVCSGLQRFEDFLAVMGWRPSLQHSIDRIDNTRGYDCGQCEDCQRRRVSRNVRWATDAQQVRNRRVSHFITYRGERRYLADVARENGLSPGQLWNRIFVLGWSVNDAVRIPIGTRPRGIPLNFLRRDYFARYAKKTTSENFKEIS